MPAVAVAAAGSLFPECVRSCSLVERMFDDLLQAVERAFETAECN